MLITPALLADEPLALDLDYAEGEMEFNLDLRQKGPLEVRGQAELLIEHRGPKETVEDIRLRAGLHGEFEQLCARCLTPVPQPVDMSFDLLFRPSEVDGEGGEHAITEDETEIGYYEKGGLLLEDVVREQVLLTLPGRTLCREECKGLCPHCGADRNTVACSCSDLPADSRWNALAGLSAALPEALKEGAVEAPPKVS